MNIPAILGFIGTVFNNIKNLVSGGFAITISNIASKDSMNINGDNNSQVKNK